MTYIPQHLEFLSRTGTADGWPDGITEVGKEFAKQRVAAGLEKYGQLDLDTAKGCIFDGYIDREPVPGELKGVTWDWLYGVTHRALLAVFAKQVWVTETAGSLYDSFRVLGPDRRRLIEQTLLDIEQDESALRQRVLDAAKRRLDNSKAN